MTGAMRACDRGFVLLNALVLVAALSAVATLSVALAVGLRTGGQAAQSAQQARLYLDAMDALAIVTLLGDGDSGQVDVAGDAWDVEQLAAPVDRGRVTGAITDLQGLFDVNRLSNPGDSLAPVQFARLADLIGLSGPVADGIAQFLRTGGPDDAAPFAQLAVPMRPIGGRILRLADLGVVPGLGPVAMDRLSQVATALPETAPLNVNTAPSAVLRAVLPDGADSAVTAFIGRRSSDPARSLDDFLARIRDDLDTAERGALELLDLGVGSGWFALRGIAELEGHRQARLTVLRRDGVPARVRVAHSIAVTP